MTARSQHVPPRFENVTAEEECTGQRPEPQRPGVGHFGVELANLDRSPTDVAPNVALHVPALEGMGYQHRRLEGELVARLSQG